MIKVVFVGDTPSSTNIHPDIAFVGAKCFERLVEWIKQLPIDYYICLNSEGERDLDKIHCLTSAGFKVIALGNKASDRLSLQKVEHFKLPHPSGLNRIINDKRKMALEMLACHTYLMDLYE